MRRKTKGGCRKCKKPVGGKLRKPCRDIRKVVVEKCFDKKPKKAKKPFNQTVKGKIVNTLDKMGADVEEAKKMKNEELLDILDAKLSECEELIKARRLEKARLERPSEEKVMEEKYEEREEKQMPVFLSGYSDEDLERLMESKLNEARSLDMGVPDVIIPEERKEFRGVREGLQVGDEKEEDALTIIENEKKVRESIRKIGRLRGKTAKKIESEKKEAFFKEVERKEKEKAREAIKKLGRLRGKTVKKIESEKKEAFFKEVEKKEAIRDAKKAIREIGQLAKRLKLKKHEKRAMSKMERKLRDIEEKEELKEIEKLLGQPVERKQVERKQVEEKKREEKEPVARPKKRVFKIRDPEITALKKKYKEKGITVSFNASKGKWSADYTAPFARQILEKGILKPIQGKARPDRTIVPEMIGEPTVQSMKKFLTVIDREIKKGTVFTKK